MTLHGCIYIRVVLGSFSVPFKHLRAKMEVTKFVANLPKLPGVQQKEIISTCIKYQNTDQPSAFVNSTDEQPTVMNITGEQWLFFPRSMIS